MLPLPDQAKTIPCGKAETSVQMNNHKMAIDDCIIRLTVA